MGGLRVALRTLSVECRLLRVSDPRAYRRGQHCIRAGPRSPEVVSWAGEGGGAGAAVGLQGRLQGQFLQRFMEQIIEDPGTEEVFKVFSQGMVGVQQRFMSDTWTFSTSPLSFLQSLALVFCANEGSWSNFLRFST